MTDTEQKYAVLAERKEYEKRLYLHDLDFAALVTDIVTPYEEKKPFFIDGVPVVRDSLLKIKIIKQIATFRQEFDRLHQLVAYQMSSGHRVPIQDYPGRLDALFRGSGIDITNSLMNAYQEKKKLNLPKEELIKGIFTLLAEGMKTTLGLLPSPQ